MISELKTVYNKLADNESRYVFEKRLMFSMTENYNYIADIARNTKIGKSVYPLLMKGMHSNGLVLDGAGRYAEYICGDFPDIEWLCVEDRNSGSTFPYNGLEIISRHEAVRRFPNAYYVISSLLFHEEAEKELLQEGIRKEQIINIGSMAKKTEMNMYFDCPFLMPKERNVFLDCGGFNGENTINFFEWSKESADSRSIIFEPDSTNYYECNERLKTNPSVKIENRAVYNKECSVSMIHTGTSSSTIQGG